MIKQTFNRTINFLVFSSIHIAAASSFIFVVFCKLPVGQQFQHYITLTQLVLAIWVVFIFIELKVNVSKGEIITKRQKFFFNNQFYLQILMLAAFLISVAILFFEPIRLIIYWGILATIVLVYLYLFHSKTHLFKEVLKPVIYCLAVVGIPFFLNSSISFSSWILAFMFFGVVFQNNFSTAYIDYLVNNNSENICKTIGIQAVRKTINIITSLNIFIVIFFFTGQTHYPNLLSFIFLILSIGISLIVANAGKFKEFNHWLT